MSSGHVAAETTQVKTMTQIQTQVVARRPLTQNKSSNKVVYLVTVGILEGAGGAPALADVGSRLSEEEIHDVIINGRTGMPGNIIKGEDAEAVAKWLAEKK